MLHTLVEVPRVREEFWPSRRADAFDGLCRRGADPPPPSTPTREESTP